MWMGQQGHRIVAAGGVVATRRTDFVVAPRGMVDSVSVRALNEPDEWGPSDHCRLEIMVS